MDWRLKVGLGIVLVIAGLLFALIEVGVLLIADCSAACRARGEHYVVMALLALGLVVAGGGAWLASTGFRSRG